MAMMALKILNQLKYVVVVTIKICMRNPAVIELSKEKYCEEYPDDTPEDTRVRCPSCRLKGVETQTPAVLVLVMFATLPCCCLGLFLLACLRENVCVNCQYRE